MLPLSSLGVFNHITLSQRDGEYKQYNAKIDHAPKHNYLKEYLCRRLLQTKITIVGFKNRSLRK